MTLIVGVKCHDGILIQGDTQFTDYSSLAAEDDAKVFPVPKTKNAPFILALSGQQDVFEDVVELFNEKFTDPNTRTPKVLSKKECKKLLRECRDLLQKELVVDRLNNRGVPLLPSNIHAFYVNLGIIFAATVTEPDGKKELLLYRLTPYEDAVSKPYLYNGSVNDAMGLFFELVSHALERFGMTWSDLTVQLAAQLLHFPYRYVPRINKTVGLPRTSFILTLDNGCQEYAQGRFFPKSYDRKRANPEWKTDYMPELLETLIATIPKEKMMKFLANDVRMKLAEMLASKFLDTS